MQSSHIFKEPPRRVSFVSEVPTQQPIIESVISNIENSRTNPVSIPNSGYPYCGKDNHCSCSFKSNVPIYKWNVSYDGSGSVTSFIEEVEQLADSRNVSRENLFRSVYEVLRGDARDWYLPRKSSFQNWDDFKQKLREAFLPLNYEENLLEEIKKRTQGLDERLILYITRMQNLFQKLNVKKPSEQEQVDIIRRNLLPNLQTALAFQGTRTIEELLSKGKEVEQIQWQAQQYCPPPTQHRLIQEPHLSYRRPVTRHIPVRAIRPHNNEHAPQAGTTTPGNQNIANTPTDQSAKNPVLVCWNCNEAGHRRNRCPLPLKLTCFKCGQVGYTVRTCPTCSKNARQGN